MQFCENPKDCQQCQLLALIGRVSLNSPKNPNALSVIKEQSSELKKQPYASLQAKSNPIIVLNPPPQQANESDGDDTPPNKMGPLTNMSIAQTVQIHKFSKEGAVSPTVWNEHKHMKKLT